ncbi:DNA mismatch repair protein MutL [Fusobacterium sp. DD29]|uniref:DNA mismatch repair endonuclease MutL n=1 Tax=unclassified Fusobacterium TaxID=2648384 RepID=UPI001B8CAA35|nr:MULTISPECIES: DNA mismatch repair endonuclease MutL [unclassified Fusobacterium]MBR8701734.1 DNA mismatch repair protein MutL [Fusobacterium sp. DD45]MBR8711514.1 DNA mismatch repair protein MutL [Fusobacterium sp. DD28]MBR8749891.1 DNA mismatch repair protein MutL [Fusobacterium sp. DD29]MBR8752064.1 DNA mismatch repair protein MutL [Fusobacterium sp. DD26]MBR8762134.1 DNA mismatch repair protein MutL [Fusobacterium sp. DD25]
MGKIKILDESVSNMIAAGEVVENPASMIKELLENSLDAGSKTIEIDIKNGGRDVKISDDGYGMTKEDLLMSVERHATSKISKKDDLYNLFTYGFRGEALSSIAAVSRISMSSRTEEDQIGSYITVLGGKVTGLKELQRNRGTTIEIKDLFFNTPARLKFLRKPSTEYGNIKDIIMQEALANPEISITLILDGKISIRTSGNGIDNAIVEIFGKNVLKNLKQFELGFLGNGVLYRSTRDSIFTFVNNRMVKSKILEDAIIDGYYTKLMKGKYPFAILFLTVDPKEVDVNVHPSKKIVKFSNEEEIYEFVLKKIEKCFEGDDDFVSPTLTEKIESDDKRFLDFSDFEQFTPIKTETQSFKEMEDFAPVNYEKIDKREEFQNTDNNIVNKKWEPKETFYNPEIEKRVSIGIEDLEKNYYSEKEEIVEKPAECKKSEDKPKEKTVNFRVIGQVFDTFILVERDGIFEIYDQHIVHERILYEKLKKMYYSDKTSMQQLLVPIRVITDPREMEIIAENMDNFKKAGFEIDRFSDNEILIRAVPMLEFNESIENIFRNVLNNIKEKRYTDIRENILISMSCKGAIKANHKLSIEDMTTMITKLHEIGEYTCPHGRPIIVKITLDDLEKLFKRK